mgnify:FL=1
MGGKTPEYGYAMPGLTVRHAAFGWLSYRLQQLGHPLGFHSPAEQITLADMETGFAQRLPQIGRAHV